MTPRDGSTKTITLALARIPRSGPLRRDLLAEAKIVAKKLRPVLTGYRLGALLCALMMLANECAGELLKAEAAGCNCVSDRKNGLYKCKSGRAHAVNTEVGR
jgi:hypothetical protein